MTVVDDRQKGPPRSQRRLATALVVVLLVAGVMVLAGAVRRDNRDRFEALVGCVTRAQPAVDGANRRIVGLTSYVGPGITGDTSAATKQSLYRLVAEAAAKSLGPVDAARAQCRAIPVRAWSSVLNDARAGYLGYLDAQRADLAAIAADGQQVYAHRPPGPLTRQAVTARLVLAAPDDAAAARVQAVIP